ncbi:hypothetical protein FQZ97_705750 [compost metagenome]
MAQDPGPHVGLAAQRIDQPALRRAGNGVDRQVAAAQVFLERDVGPGVERKALVAAPGLALGARQRVFLFAAGMQEDGEIAAHRDETAARHLFRRGAHHDPVVVAGRQAEQRVAHCSAHDIDLQTLRGRIPAHGIEVFSAPNGTTLPRRSFRDWGWPLNIAA